jgi:hypothetical protein
VDLGGQNNDCEAVGSDAFYSYRIESPDDGVWIDNQSGVNVSFTLNTYKQGPNEFLDWDAGLASVSNVIVKGGNNSANHDYINPPFDSTWPGGRATSDNGAHAPEQRTNRLYSVSHVTFCYDIVGTISGHKWHDNDTDGTQDETFEDDLSGWVITAYASDDSVVGTDTTDTDGDYSIPNVPLGASYRVCETAQTLAAPFSWGQSTLSASSWGDTNCDGLTNQAPGGHAFTMNTDAPGIDFGNHSQVTLSCTAGGFTSATLGGEGEPESTVSLPDDCTSESFVSPFDVGRSDDGDSWKQFVIFGGDPTSDAIVTQTIIWDPEDADYSTGSLSVPTTLVRLGPGAALQPVVFCTVDESGLLLDPDPGGSNSIGDETMANLPRPNDWAPDCLSTRSIAEGAPTVPVGKIQITETYKFFGDPPRFR